jgi:DNA-binding XRE family transcriptional regulator
MINTNKIKGRIVELGMTQDTVAKAMEMAQSTFCLKIGNKRPMNISECKTLMEILCIPESDIVSYFFA